MNNIKVHNLFNNLEKVCQICFEVDTFMGNILEWADELLETVEKEYAEVKESTSFQLPKTPSEKKTLNKKARNRLLSKCSELNSTVDCNEISNLDNSISTRTRAARRVATSKVSLSNTIKVNQELLTIETHLKTKAIEKNENEELSEVTFLAPQTSSTRTKPVVKSKLQTITVIEPTNSATELSRNKVVRSATVNLDELPRIEISANFSGSGLHQLNVKEASTVGEKSLKEQLSRNKISKLLNENSDEQSNKKKATRALSGSSPERQNKRKLSQTLTESPTIPPLLTRPESQIERSISSKSKNISCKNPSVRCSKSMTAQQDIMLENVQNGENDSIVNRTITIKKEEQMKTSTFIISQEEEKIDANNDFIDDEEQTPRVKNRRFTGISKTSTPVINLEQIPPNAISDETVTSTQNEYSIDTNIDATFSIEGVNLTIGESEDNLIPKKKRKLKKENETFKENLEEVGDTVRITRTKSKAIKQMMEDNETETKQADLAVFAKKLLNRAKMASLKKNHLATLLENNSSTPLSGPGVNNLQFATLLSKSKNNLLLISSKKLKTPLATLPNSTIKIPKPSSDKSRHKAKAPKRDSSIENLVRTVNKPSKNEVIEKEMKLKSKKEKEEEAAMKRQNVIKNKQEELKRKNELKHQLAMKQREKLEQEKYNNMIQSEKEKEERHKVILQERQMKLKEEAFKKKMITQQKIAETTERRRLEEEARIAKLKEMEAEEQRLALEKQREQERQEKREQERLAQKKAREEYEMQLKQKQEAERLKTEKMCTAKKYLQSGSKLQSASKRPKFGLLTEKKEWDYKPRNENDYGLEDEHSDVDSEDEKSQNKIKPPMLWGEKIMDLKVPQVKIITLEIMCEYMPCYQKSPDIYKMFKMTPSKRIKRTSSAIWNTPSS